MRLDHVSLLTVRNVLAIAAFISTLVPALAPGAAIGASALFAQTSRGWTGPETTLLPEDVSFVVRIDAAAFSRSELLPRLLEHPEASNSLARALARPETLARLRTVYVGFPAGFTPESRELPVLIGGAFSAKWILGDLSSVEGVERRRTGARTFLVAEGPQGTSYATPLGDGILALGDEGSVARMVEIWEGKRDGAGSALDEALEGEGRGPGHIVGAGRVPVALRGYLQAAGGGLAAPFATVERLSFEGSLERKVDLYLSLHAATPEGRQAIEQALGALRLFGPSRFADDPEVLSAIQSLQFTIGADPVDVSVTLPRSLLLRML